MKYLFFDEECAASINDGNIIEFGYIITDEHFKVIEKKNFCMNPSLNGVPWDQFVVKHLLSYDVDFYENCPTFPFYYERIKKLINDADYIFGHTISGDVKRLNEECKKFNLPYLNFTFYDIKEIYKEFINVNRNIGLQTIVENEGIESFGTAHNAKFDAGNTMLCLKKMVDDLDLDVTDLISICQSCIDRTNEGVIESNEVNKLIRQANIYERLDNSNDNRILSSHKNNKIFKKFIRFVTQTEKIDDPIFNNKKFCISLNYEEDHFHEMLNIIQLLKNRGASFIHKASLANIFITYNKVLDNGTIKKCSRLKYVTEEVNKGKDIEIMEFQELLNHLGVSEEDLIKNEYFDRTVFFRPKPKKDYSIYNDKCTNTLADFIK